MFVPMSRENLEILASHVKGEVVQVRESNFLVVQGITFSISKEDATYKINAFQPEVNRNASTFHSEAKWKELTTSIKVSSEKPLETIAKDILRRFDFPAMVEVKGMFDADEQRYEEEKVKHSNLVDELEEACGRKANRRTTGVESEISLYTVDSYYGDIKVSYTSVEISIRSLKNNAMAKTIASLLKKPVKDTDNE
jgi:hypothetical protein